MLKAITQHVWQRGLKQTSVFLWNQSAFSWRSKQILIWEERGNWLSLENEVLAKKQEYNPRQRPLLKVLIEFLYFVSNLNVSFISYI
jgi:hypothetical protein